MFTVSIAAYWITGGLTFRAWVPLFSTLVCFWFVAALSAYDYLKAEQYPLARIGLGFAILSIVILLLEAIVWGADRMVLRSAETVSLPEFTELKALFSSLHTTVLWTIGIWYALWGVGFLRMSSGAKLTGATMIGVAGAHVIDYLLLRLAVTGQFVEIWHLVGSQGLNLVAYSALGVVLLKASRSDID
jgi:hypothetical protein